MVRTSNLKLSTDKIWFGVLVMYIAVGYFAQDVILPASVNSIVLYAFLALSAFLILCSRKIKLTSIVIWEIICLALAFFAMLYAPSFSVFGGTYYSLIVNFILVFILTQMPWTEKRFHLIMKTFVFSSAGLIIVLAATGNLSDESGRLGTELMGNANILAIMLMVSAVYGMWLLVSSGNMWQRLGYLTLLSVIYLGMFLSGGRKFIVVPLVFVFVFVLNKTDKNGRKHMIRNALLVLAAVVAVWLIIMKAPFLYESIGHRFEGFLALFDDRYDVDGSTLNRTRMVKAAFSRWLRSPIWGYGFDSFKYYNAASVTGHMYYSHNNFTELLYNQGILGFIGYYWFYAFVLIKALKSNADSIYKGFSVAVVISLLIFEFFGVSYIETPVQIMLFFVYYNLDKRLFSKSES